MRPLPAGPALLPNHTQPSTYLLTTRQPATRQPPTRRTSQSEYCAGEFTRIVLQKPFLVFSVNLIFSFDLRSSMVSFVSARRPRVEHVSPSSCRLRKPTLMLLQVAFDLRHVPHPTRVRQRATLATKPTGVRGAPTNASSLAIHASNHTGPSVTYVIRCSFWLINTNSCLGDRAKTSTAGGGER